MEILVTKPTLPEEWAKYIARHYGCIHDTEGLFQDILLIRYQAQEELNAIGDFIDEAVDVSN